MAAMASHFRIATVVVRVVFAAVFAVNVQCALSFVLTPSQFTAGFMLDGSGVVGDVAVAGLGVAFLMWNATYPAFIIAPARFRVLGWVVLAQQLIGLVGEVWLLGGLGPEYAVLRASLLRFAVFDGVGLVLMSAVFTWFSWALKKKDVL